MTFNDILFFSSGCKELPPFGLKLSMRFLHTPEKDGSLSQYPKANTSCSCILSLPTIHTKFKQFKEALTFAFLNTKGFGEPCVTIVVNIINRLIFRRKSYATIIARLDKFEEHFKAALFLSVIGDDALEMF